jgi:uncharacterized lipoprotein
MIKFSKVARVAVPLAFAALLGLAACSKEPSREQTDEPGNYADDQNAGEIPPEAAPKPVETLNQTPPANVAVAVPVDHTTEDQQMQEDADASGMTSRLSPSDQTAPANMSEKVQ